MNSPLQLNNYFVADLSYRSNEAYRVEAKVRHEGTIHCNAQLGTGQNAPDHFMVSLQLVLEPSEVAPALDPYHISMRIVGFFNFPASSGISQEDKERMVALNGCSILMGLARGLVAQATGVSEFGKYLLPPLNFVDIANKLTSSASTYVDRGTVPVMASADQEQP